MAAWTDEQLEAELDRTFGPRPLGRDEQIGAMVVNFAGRASKQQIEAWVDEQLPNIRASYDEVREETRANWKAHRPAPEPPKQIDPKWNNDDNDPEAVVQWLVQVIESKGLKVRNGYGQWNAQCSAHDDRQPSMYLKAGDRGALIGCRAGCSIDDIVAGLGITKAELFTGPR